MKFITEEPVVDGLVLFSEIAENDFFVDSNSGYLMQKKDKGYANSITNESGELYCNSGYPYDTNQRVKPIYPRIIRIEFH